MTWDIALILVTDGLANGAVYLLAGLGLVLIFSVTRVVFVPFGDIAAFAALMQAAVQAGAEAIDDREQVVVSGERNLLAVRDFSADLGSLRKMFDLFEHKTQLMRLLEVSSKAEGVRIFIGGESMVVPFEELSVVSAPYEVDGQVVGTLGVIGPTRMAYDRMIQIVDITSRLLGNALSQKGSG